MLEVRANEMPILLEDDQFVGRLHYYKMAATPDKVYGCSIGSSYQQQGLALSKQFKRDQQYASGSASIAAAKAKDKVEPAHTEADDDDSILRIAFPESSGEHRINAKNR